MVRLMHDSATAPERVRTRFEERAHQFDDLYEDERWLVRTLRPGLFRRRKLAVDTVARVRRAPRPRRRLRLGPDRRVRPRGGRRAALRRGRLLRADDRRSPARGWNTASADRTELIVDDFLTASLTGPFEVILAVGLFDYLPEPHRFSRRMFDLTAPGRLRGRLVPHLVADQGPGRKVRYEWIGNCPIFNYSRRELELMFGASGFERVEIHSPGRSGFLVRAYRN